MNHSLKVIPLITIIVVSVLLSLGASRVPEDIPVGEYPDGFSMAAVMNHVNAISLKPHPIGSEEHSRVREYLISWIEAQGLVAEIQETTIINMRNQQPTPVKNVLTRLNGRKGEFTMMLVAHYDTQINTPGAGDDGAGVAIILESMRYFMSRPPMDHNIIFLMTDGEEFRSVGAKGFVKEHQWAAEVDFLVNMDTRGSDGIAYAYEMSDRNGKLVEALAKGVKHPVSASFMYEIYKMLPNYSDFTVFRDEGMAGINIAFIEGFHTYHTMLDTPENLNPNSVNHMASYAIPLLEYMDNQPLDQLNSKSRNFFNPAGLWFVHYPTWLDRALFVLLIILFVILLNYGRKRQILVFRNLFKMALLLLVGLVVITGLTFLLNQLILSIHPWYDPQNIRGGTFHPKHFIILFSIINLSLFILVMRRITRKMTSWEVGFGVLFLWVLLALLCQLTISSLSYLILVPSFPMILALVISERLNSLNHFVKAGLVALLTWPATFLLVPMVPSIAIALGISQPIGPSIISILLLSIYLIAYKASNQLREASAPYHSQMP